MPETIKDFDPKMLMKAGKDLLAKYPPTLLAEAEEVASDVPQLGELLNQVKAILMEIDSQEEIPAEAVQVMEALQMGVKELKQHQTIAHPLEPSRATTMAHQPASSEPTVPPTFLADTVYGGQRYGSEPVAPNTGSSPNVSETHDHQQS